MILRAMAPVIVADCPTASDHRPHQFRPLARNAQAMAAGTCRPTAPTQCGACWQSSASPTTASPKFRRQGGSPIRCFPTTRSSPPTGASRSCCCTKRRHCRIDHKPYRTLAQASALSASTFSVRAIADTTRTRLPSARSGPRTRQTVSLMRTLPRPLRIGSIQREDRPTKPSARLLRNGRSECSRPSAPASGGRPTTRGDRQHRRRNAIQPARACP